MPVVAPDGDVYAFVLPGFEEGAATVEVGGEFVTAFSDDAATVAVLEYMSTPEWADIRVGLGGNVSANLNADPSLASSEFLTEAMELLQDPNTTVRFDASDLMPATVGCRVVLEGDGGLDRRQGHGNGPERHPGRLRELGSDGGERGHRKWWPRSRANPRPPLAERAPRREASKSPTTHSEGDPCLK